MKTLLFPYQSLSSFRKSVSPGMEDRLVRTSALLLFAEQLNLGRVGFPQELPLPSDDEVQNEIDAILAKHGQEIMLDNYLENDRLTWDETVTLFYAESCNADKEFFREYWPLIEANIIQIPSLASEIKMVEAYTAYKGTNPGFSLDFESLLQTLLSDFQYSSGWLCDPELRQAIGFGAADYDGLGLMSMYLRQVLKRGDCFLLESTDRFQKSLLFEQAYLLGIDCQTFLSFILGVPVTAFSQTHIGVRAMYAQARQDVELDNPVDRLAQHVCGEVLAQIPTAVPRSVESILYLREQLSYELEQFRSAVHRVSEDLIDEQEHSIEQGAIVRRVREQFKRPLEDLQARLAHPNKEMMRNLVSSSSIITGGVTLSVASIAGSPKICSALLGLAVPILAESFKLKFARDREAEQKGELAFLYKTVQRKPL